MKLCEKNKALIEKANKELAEMERLNAENARRAAEMQEKMERAKKLEEKEANHRRRKDEGQGEKSIEGALSRSPVASEEERRRHPGDENDCGGEGRHLDGEDDDPQLLGSQDRYRPSRGTKPRRVKTARASGDCRCSRNGRAARDLEEVTTATG